MTSNRIYHIALPDAWEAARADGVYASPSLVAEGFIHCSDAHQVERSLNRFFRGRSAVVLLEIDPARLKSELRYEGADNDMFPHIYGMLNVDAVVGEERLTPDADGRFTYSAGE